LHDPGACVDQDRVRGTVFPVRIGGGKTLWQGQDERFLIRIKVRCRSTGHSFRYCRSGVRRCAPPRIFWMPHMSALPESHRPGVVPRHDLSDFELVCPAGSLPALKAAVDEGADAVYLGFRDATNARNFAGLNFDAAAIAEGIRYAHDRQRKVLLALNTYPQPDAWQLWRDAVDRAAGAGVDAVIMADPGLMAYA